MSAGGGRQVLVKAKAAHYLHDIGSGKMATALQICIAEQQVQTLSDLLECLRKLMQPVVDKEVFSLLSNVQVSQDIRQRRSRVPSEVPDRKPSCRSTQ